MKKITKEELIADNARLKAELDETNKEFANYGNVARRNLATTLGIHISRADYFNGTEATLPEWSEIYARIGALRTIEEQGNGLRRIEAIEDKLDQFMKEVAAGKISNTN